MSFVSSYVLDSYALIAYFEGEVGAEIVRDILIQNEDNQGTVLMSVVNLGEVYYSMSRAKGRKRADDCLDVIGQLPITMVPVDRAAALAAAKIKAVSAVAYGDCFAAALAAQTQRPIVTGDKEFKKIAGVDVLWLG